MIKARNEPALQPRNHRTTDLIGLALFAVGAACLIWLTLPQDALAGRAVDNVFRLLAGTGAYVIPILLMFIGSMFLVGFDRITFTHSSYGSLLLFITYSAWRHVASYSTVATSPMVGVTPSDMNWSEEHVKGAGGYIGAVIGTMLMGLCGPAVSYIFLVMMACMAMVLLVDRPFIELLRWLKGPALSGVSAAKQGVNVIQQKSVEKRDARIARLAALAEEEEQQKSVQPEENAKRKRRGLLSLGDNNGTATEGGVDRTPPVSDPAALAGAALAKVQSVSQPKPNETLPSPQELLESGTEYRLPPMSLLKEYLPASNKNAQQELADKITVLEQTLDQFGIGANVVEIAHGPTVTRYEIQLAPGIKVAKIVSLADNLAMALEAIDVRVEAPIPGKAAIGIEVPNSVPAIVSLRECIDTPEFVNAPGKLLFALGKDVAGVTKYADLTRMPHLLIGGSTNSGKSVCLNVLIASILYRSSPREVKFIMIDPKRVELSLWDGIPHLMHPVIKDVKQTAGIFRAALKEMERRYDTFSRAGTRNIEGYNQKVDEEEKLPYIVIVVDELADLMMQAAAEIETSICRLAQLARATGIHLVIATQRPSVDVITGTIKANISSRIAFAVASQVDSRTVLDQTGADRLIGRGDMLYLPIDAGKPLRIQGCFLSEQETNALVHYLIEQEDPTYGMMPVDVAGIGESMEGGDGDLDDALFERAVRLVVTNGQASTSMLQRRFKIGYTRAARIMDFMEQRGIVGPPDGAKPREILVSKDDIDNMFLDY